MSYAAFTTTPDHAVPADERPSMASTTVAEGSPTPKQANMTTGAFPPYWRPSFWLHMAGIVAGLIYCIIVGTMWLPKYGLTTIALWSSIALIAPILSILVSGGELATRLLRENDRGWLPAVHIGLNLITWLAGLGLGGFNAFFWGYFNDTTFGDWEDDCPDPDGYGLKCYGIPLLPQYMVLVLLLFFLAVSNFALFIIAIKQHQARQALKRQAPVA